MDVYVVQTSRTGKGEPIGVYRKIDRAREEADANAAVSFGQITQTTSTQLPDGTEMRVHLFEGKPIGSHAIFHFTLDEEVDNPDLSEPEIKPRRGVSLDEDV
jgi:hypothetical protein